MNIPRIIFRYSWIYDQSWKERKRVYRKGKERYPSSQKIINYIEKVEKLWNKQERRILQELSLLSGLKWKSESIKCYVVGRCIPFSDPLTLPLYEGCPDYFIDTLIHELIHQLFTQEGNLEQSEKAWNYINRKYRKESYTTRIHIPLHAIHAHIYMKFFDENRLKRDIREISHLPDYRKSWEIVKKEGHQNIIQEFTRRIEKI